MMLTSDDPLLIWRLHACRKKSWWGVWRPKIDRRAMQILVNFGNIS